MSEYFEFECASNLNVSFGSEKPLTKYSMFTSYDEKKSLKSDHTSKDLSIILQNEDQMSEIYDLKESSEIAI